MDYQRIYNQIVERAKSQNRTRKGKIYYEAHHILPKCLGGEGKKWELNHSNIVLLTAREHYICHWLLFRIYPNNRGIAYAFWMMSNGCYSDKQHRYIPSSRAYNESKESLIKNKIGRKQSKETVKKRVDKNKGQKRNKSFSKKISEINKGNQYMLGYKYTEEQRERQSQAKLGKPKKGKKVEQLDMDGNLIREWDSVSKASEGVKIGISGISYAISGKQKSAGGFKWRFVRP
jgi:hypothetical protein